MRAPVQRRTGSPCPTPSESLPGRPASGPRARSTPRSTGRRSPARPGRAISPSPWTAAMPPRWRQPARAAVLWDGADWQALGLEAALFAPRARLALAGLTEALAPQPEIEPGLHPAGGHPCGRRARRGCPGRPLHHHRPARAHRGRHPDRRQCHHRGGLRDRRGRADPSGRADRRTGADRRALHRAAERGDRGGRLLLRHAREGAVESAKAHRRRGRGRPQHRLPAHPLPRRHRDRRRMSRSAPGPASTRAPSRRPGSGAAPRSTTSCRSATTASRRDLSDLRPCRPGRVGQGRRPGGARRQGRRRRQPDDRGGRGARRRQPGRQRHTRRARS